MTLCAGLSRAACFPLPPRCGFVRMRRREQPTPSLIPGLAWRGCWNRLWKFRFGKDLVRGRCRTGRMHRLRLGTVLRPPHGAQRDKACKAIIFPKYLPTRGSFPSEEAAFKLLYLTIRNLTGKWESIQHWREALNRFQILWPERIAAAQR